MPIGRRFGTRHPCRAPEPEAPAAWFVQCEVIPSDMARGPAGRLEVGREYSGPLWLVNISFASRKSRPKNLRSTKKAERRTCCSSFGLFADELQRSFRRVAASRRIPT